jgi:hypothetical protein
VGTKSPGPINALALTPMQELAARLVAQDTLLDRAIALECGVVKSTLERWKNKPAFRSAVERHRLAWRQLILEEGIADKARRIERLQKRWDAIDSVFRQRAQEAAELLREMWDLEDKEANEDNPLAKQILKEQIAMLRENLGAGMDTGIVCRERRSVGDSVETFFRVDVSTLNEERQIAKQAAIELAQWQEDPPKPPSEMTDEELRREAAAILGLSAAGPGGSEEEEGS